MFGTGFQTSWLSICMFHELGYGTNIDYEIMGISHDTKIICGGTKVYGLYMLDGSIIIDHALVAGRD